MQCRRGGRPEIEQRFLWVGVRICEGDDKAYVLESAASVIGDRVEETESGVQVKAGNGEEVTSTVNNEQHSVGEDW